MTLRPCWVEIRARSLEDNYRFLAGIAAPHAELLAIVKADAYGHSLALCAPVAVRAGARWLGVTSVEEGVAARALCPDARILAISGAFAGQGADVVRHRLTPEAWEPWQLDELESAAREACGYWVAHPKRRGDSGDALASPQRSVFLHHARSALVCLGVVVRHPARYSPPGLRTERSGLVVRLVGSRDFCAEIGRAHV